MVYVIVAYKKGKKLGQLKDWKGRIMKFMTKKEAITTAHIESQQMENRGLKLKVRRLVKRK